MEASEDRAPEVRSDRELVLAFQAGDRAAYDEMYERYAARVHGVCLRILHQPQDAEEAAQETFARAYQALHRFNGRYQLGAWLARIASNASVDQLRAKTRAPVVGLPGDREPAESDADPEQLIVGEYPRLTAALSSVKPLHAQALAMRSVEGFSHEEIADRLAMTPAQVKALLHRARVSLRKAWERAENWLVAPVISLRSLLDDRSNSAAGSSLATATPVFSPLLAEKVAATALVMVVALSGLPNLVEVVHTPRGQHGSRSAASGRPHAARTGGVQERQTGHHRRAAAEVPTAAPSAEELHRLIKTTLEGEQLNGPKEKRAPQKDDPLPKTASSAAKDLLREVREVLPQGGPQLPPL